MKAITTQNAYPVFMTIYSSDEFWLNFIFFKDILFKKLLNVNLYNFLCLLISNLCGLYPHSFPPLPLSYNVTNIFRTDLSNSIF